MATSVALRMIALITLLTAIVDGVSISHFACNDTWNPSIDCSAKLLVKDVCRLQLRVTDLVSDSANGSTPAPSSGKREHALLQLIVTSGIESLRSTSLHGVDYWIVGSHDISFVSNDETDVSLLDVTITTPNICGQTFLLIRIIEKSGDSVERAIPLQLKCPEKQVDLALVGIVQEDYDVYNHRPVLHVTGQPISRFIPDFKLFVHNDLKNTSFSARTGPSAYTVSVYIKPQQWNMYEWSVGNNSQQTVLHVDVAQLEYRVGDVMVNEGNRLVPTDGGRHTLTLPGGSQTELLMENLVLNSKEVCGNGIMVVQLKVPHQPSDSNRINDFYFLPVFIDCWGHNPVKTIETCEVIPNFYNGGKIAWITYTVSGQTKIYEYNSEERSIRELNTDVDVATMQDIALMKLTTSIQSDRLKALGQCVNTMWGSSDAFVTSVDVLLTSVRKDWEEVAPKGQVQKLEHSKISLILNTVSDMLTLALQPSNPLHNWLHIPFQWYFNPLVPYDSNAGPKHPVDTNQISRRKRDIGGTSFEDDGDEFEAAAQQKSPVQSNSISFSTTNASAPVSTSTLASVSGFSFRSTTGLPPLTVTLNAHTAGNATKAGTGSMADSLSKGPILAGSGNGQSTASATTVANTLSSTSRGMGSSAATGSTAARAENAATLRGSSASSAAVSSATPVQGASSTVRAAASTPYGASSTPQTKTGENGAGSFGTMSSTLHDVGSTGTTVRASGSMASTARSVEHSGTTAGVAGSIGTTTRRAASASTTVRAIPSTGTTARSSGSTASTVRSTGSSAVSAASTNRTAGFSAATTAQQQGAGSAVTTNVPRVTPTTASTRGQTVGSGVTTTATITTSASNTSLKTTAGASATTKGSQTSGNGAAVTVTTARDSTITTKNPITTASTGTITTKASGVTIKETSTSSGKTTADGQASTAATKLPTSTTANELLGDEKYFGPKPKWHEQVMEQLYEMVKYSGKGLYNLTPQRWHAISAFLHTLLYGHKEDFERYSYIPKSTWDGLCTLMKMAIGQNLPRLFDDIPSPILKAVNDWMKAKYQRHIEVGNSACDFQEGLELALNVTQEMLVQKQWQERSDQLVMLAHIFRIFLKSDHTQYLSELYTRITAAHKMSRTWMIRDGVPIHEPDEKDVCQRYTAVKLWQLKTFPVFQFAGQTVSPDQYQSVFWTQEKGTIFRGDRSELTGQVFWSKVATCSCPAGSTCGGNVAMTQNGVNTMTDNSLVTGQPMAVEPLRAQVNEGIDLTNDDDDTDGKDSFVGFGLEETEDMVFGDQ